jgi:hypothetical protein
MFTHPLHDWQLSHHLLSLSMYSDAKGKAELAAKQTVFDANADLYTELLAKLRRPVKAALKKMNADQAQAYEEKILREAAIKAKRAEVKERKAAEAKLAAERAEVEAREAKQKEEREEVKRANEAKALADVVPAMDVTQLMSDGKIDDVKMEGLMALAKKLGGGTIDVNIMDKLKELSEQQAAQFLARQLAEAQQEARMKSKIAAKKGAKEAKEAKVYASFHPFPLTYLVLTMILLPMIVPRMLRMPMQRYMRVYYPI